MATNTNGGFMGHQVGKLGPSVGYVIDGFQFYRAYNSRVRNPRTVRQMVQRKKFSLLGKLGSVFKVAVNIGFMKHMLPLQSGLSMFMMRNIDKVGGSTPSEVTVDITTLQLSEGTLPQAGLGQAKATEALTVNVPMTDNSDLPGARDDDKVYIVVYQPDMELAILSSPFTRSSSMASVTVPSDWSGMDVHVYGFTQSVLDSTSEGMVVNSAGETSKTSYLGSVSII